MPDIGERRKVKRGDKGYHTDTYIWLACPECRKERWVKKHYPSPPLCRVCNARRNGALSQGCSGSAHGMWNGGRIKTRGGYIRIWLPSDSPFYSMTDRANHTVLEHRLVMATFLGRCLEKLEIVHHKDGDKQNNSLENLELLPSRKEHLVDTFLRRRIAELESRVLILEAELTLVKTGSYEMRGEVKQRKK